MKKTIGTIVLVMMVAASCGQRSSKSQPNVSRSPEIREEAVVPEVVMEVASSVPQIVEVSVKDTLFRRYIETDLADFPKDFKTYYAKFGDIDSPDYYSSDESLSEVVYNSDLPRELVCSKLVAVCIDGKWDADEINFLMSVMHSMALEYPAVLSSELKKHSEKEQISFWNFCFDSPYPRNYKEVYDKMLSIEELQPFSEQIKTVYKRNSSRNL